MLRSTGRRRNLSLQPQRSEATNPPKISIYTESHEAEDRWEGPMVLRSTGRQRNPNHKEAEGVSSWQSLGDGRSPWDFYFLLEVHKSAK